MNLQFDDIAVRHWLIILLLN